MDAIESHVRTIIACALDLAPPEDVRPECHLLAGIASYERLRGIARSIEVAYGTRFSLGARECWVSVADVVQATEGALREARRAA
jgi:hypothetical protein